MSASQPDIASNPEVRELTTQTDQLVAIAQTYKVSTPDQYTDAGEQLKQIKAASKRLEDLRLTMTRPLDATKKAIMDFFRAPELKLKTAEAGVKRAMIAYSDEQDRIRREEQARANAEARKQQEKLQQQAAKAIASGKVEKAVELETRAAAVVAPVVNREPPKIAGIGDRVNWKAECVDLKALVKAVAEGRAPLSYVMANDKVLGQQARSLKADFVCDGVRVWGDKNIAAGAA